MDDIKLTLLAANVPGDALKTTLTDSGFPALRTAVANKMYQLRGRPGIVRIYGEPSSVYENPIGTYVRTVLAFSLFAKEMLLQHENVYITDLLTLHQYLNDEEEYIAGTYDSIDRCVYLAVADTYQLTDSGWPYGIDLNRVGVWMANMNRRGNKGFVLASQCDSCEVVASNEGSNLSPMWPVSILAYLRTNSIGFTV